MRLFKPIDKYVMLNETGKLSINPDFTLDDVLDKLHYYELIETSLPISAEWRIFGNYRVSCSNYAEYNRTYYAYDMPIDIFLKACPNATTRTINALKRADIKTVKDLIDSRVSWSWQIIDKVNGIGKEQMREIHKTLLALKDWARTGLNKDGQTEFITMEENKE